MASTQLVEPARRESQKPDARAVPLDRREFSARFFPYRRRHDLEAIAAYGAYRITQREEVSERVRTAAVQ